MRAVVVGLGLAGLALTVPTFAAAPDKAPPHGKKNGANAKRGKEKCCLVQLEGPAGTVTVGGAPARFDFVVSRSGKAGKGCTPTRRTITVRLAGLATEHVRFERVVSGQVLALRDTSSEAGTVEAVDQFVDSKLICGEDAVEAASYRIAFLDGSPSGPAELVVSALAANGDLLDSARTTTAVVEAVDTTAPPPETTPPAPPVTEDPVEETSAPPPVQRQEPVPPETPAEVPAARPPLARTADNSPIPTTLLTASLVFAFTAILLLAVLWRLRRTRAAANEAPTASLPTGVGAELARLTESDGAAGTTKPAAP